MNESHADTDRDAQHVLELIRANGYVVMAFVDDGLSLAGEHLDTTHGVIAGHADPTKDRCTRGHATLYAAACELAERCGIDLRDG